MTGFEAVIVAGGRASRMGGAAKPMLELAGRTLLERTVSAARAAGSSEITVVGPVLDGGLDVRWVREDPPYGGPAAALGAALPVVGTDWVLVLPADLVSPDRAVRALSLSDRRADGAHLSDDDGRPQWLTGMYRVAGLRERFERYAGEVDGLSMRRLLEDLRLAPVPAGSDAAADIDTWEHLRMAHRRVSGMETS